MKRAISLLLAMLLAVIAFVGCTQVTAPNPTTEPEATGDKTAPAATQEAPYSYADTIAWDGEYDVIVVGFGGAGAVAAKTAAENGARVLILEKEEEGHEGGNTKVCGQMFANGHNDPDAVMQYYEALMGNHEVPEAMLQVYVNGIAKLADKLVEDFGANAETIYDFPSDYPFVGPMSPEYPEFPGSSKITLSSIDGNFGNAALWQLLRKNVTDRADNIDVWFESPGMRLIQHPETKTILGVTAERKGVSLNIRANNGVVLTTGGFENNAQMVANYLGLANYAPFGALSNTGDGIKMAMEIGADLWHMEAYESAGMSYAVAQGERAQMASYTTGAAILVGGDGSRYLKEDETARHGHRYYAGVWINYPHPKNSFFVMDHTEYELTKEAIPENVASSVMQADTLEALAAETGMDPAILANTVSNFNEYAKTGVDLEHNRSAKSMRAFDKGPYYAVKVIPIVFNTQGGPRRNENAEILDVNGKPIPHLYSAGELGGITAYQYQGGGNIAECIIFGEIAGENAAKAKGDLPAYSRQRVESNPTYTPGFETDIKSDLDISNIETTENEFIGEATGMGGTLRVKVVLDGDSILSVELVSHSETEGVSDPAIKQIPEAIVAANSPEVDTIAGATITSNAIKEAVKEALATAGR